MKPLKWIIILFCLLTSPANAADWRLLSPMPHGRYGHDTTLGPEGKIYVMGGMVFGVGENNRIAGRFDDGRYSNLVYDIKKDEWRYLEPVPGWVFIDEKVFMVFDLEMGGWTTAKKIDNEEGMYAVFNIYTKKQENKNIPSHKLRRSNLQRQGNGVAIVTGKDGRIYWLGGMGKSSWGGGLGEDIVLPYDTLNKKWPPVSKEKIIYKEFKSENSYSATIGHKTIYQTEVPPMLERRIDHKAVVMSDGKIYVFGGYRTEYTETQYGGVKPGDVKVIDSVECYDPDKNKWEFKKNMNKKLFLLAAVAGPDEKIYIFGGCNFTKVGGRYPVFDLVEVYDPKTDTWSSRKPMPEPRFGHSGVLGGNGMIYIMGGGSEYGGPPLDTVFIYDPIRDKWEKGPSMNYPRDSLAAITTPEGKIYAIGGTDIGAYKTRQRINYFLPSKRKVYDGKVQDTVEVLDIFEK